MMPLNSSILLRDYEIERVDQLMTPALAIYPAIVERNIATTLRLLGGDAGRWRPHVKTSKLGFTMRKLVQNGITNFKCSTSLELLTACESGARDVLLAYPVVGANAARVADLARRFDNVAVSALVEDQAQIRPWLETGVSVFIDINPGMNRTGVEQERVDDIVELAKTIRSSGQKFRGLHYYDGHLSSLEMLERERVAHAGYDVLMKIISALDRAGIEVGEVITAGTPAFPCTLSYAGFEKPSFVHRASPGTVVYNDCSSLIQLPSDYDYRPAAVVVSTVVSRPARGKFTCDAGHKTVSADAGAPTCAVIGKPGYSAAKPSEEHLPVEVAEGDTPAIGDRLYLVPRHICPTVNNFDHAILIDEGRIVGLESVTARGREAPLLEDQAHAIKS